MSAVFVRQFHFVVISILWILSAAEWDTVVWRNNIPGLICGRRCDSNVIMYSLWDDNDLLQISMSETGGHCGAISSWVYRPVIDKYVDEADYF